MEKPNPAQKRDPFASKGRIDSREAALKSRDLASRSELKQIRKAGVRHSGKKVVTDDVKILKSLAVTPPLPKRARLNSYVEPVRIEYYIPKESRFAIETRYLYIPLIDPVPRKDPDDEILADHIRKNRFFDLMEVMNENPIRITDILESYNSTLTLYESLSRSIQESEEDQTNADAFRKSFYLCETLMDYEPTLASLEFLGDFLGWNLNWLVRKMNSLEISISASDKTVSYFIKKRNIYYEERNLPYDERFEVLAALFFEQAYPSRSLMKFEDDYFFNMF